MATRWHASKTMLSRIDVATSFRVKLSREYHGMPLCGVRVHCMLVTKVYSTNRAWINNEPPRTNEYHHNTVAFFRCGEVWRLEHQPSHSVQLWPPFIRGGSE